MTVQQRRLTVYQQRRQHCAIPTARRALAAALHSDGQCADAQQEIRAALHAEQSTAYTTLPSSKPLLRAYLRILTGCGKAGQARTALAQHADLFGPPDSDIRDVTICATAIDAARPPAKRCAGP